MSGREKTPRSIQVGYHHGNEISCAHENTRYGGVSRVICIRGRTNKRSLSGARIHSREGSEIQRSFRRRQIVYHWLRRYGSSGDTEREKVSSLRKRFSHDKKTSAPRRSVQLISHIVHAQESRASSIYQLVVCCTDVETSTVQRTGALSWRDGSNKIPASSPESEVVTRRDLRSRR